MDKSEIRIINPIDISNTVAKLFGEANINMQGDIVSALKKAHKEEINLLPKEALSLILENAEIAKQKEIPICQDTGMAIVYIEIGNKVVVDGDIYQAVNAGIAKATEKYYLRASIVADPLNRINTNNNSPAITYIKITEGDKLRITVMPKGFGSENMSFLKMFLPTASKVDIMKYVVECVKQAGANPCPPIIVGVGIGGTSDYAMFLAKKSLLRGTNIPSIHPYYANMEKELLNKINETNIGVQGFGGKHTALSVNIKPYPTHIAGLPVAVTIGCHVCRHASMEI